LLYLEQGAATPMKKSTPVCLTVAGLVLLLAHVPVAAVSPTAPNPYPTRVSKPLADFETPLTVASDPTNTGKNLASINTDPQFVAEGSKSLKLDYTGLTGPMDPGLAIQFPQPVDIKGYQVLAMDVLVPDTAIDTTSWYQLLPHPTTTSPTDDSMTTDTFYGPGNMHAGWNHLIWNLKAGTDTRITRLTFGLDSGAAYSGPIYVDNIRVYKGSFAGLQPDEKLIMGFDKGTDSDFFTTLGNSVTVGINTDPQFISQGTGSLKVDLTGQPSGWQANTDVARADDWGTTLDASRATAIHLDVLIPPSSYTATDYQELGFGVVGDGGDVAGLSHGVENVLGQWITLELALTPDQAQMLTNVKGLFFITNSGSAWTGPIYVDNLRAVIATR
jgi:hypothetical protein